MGIIRATALMVATVATVATIATGAHASTPVGSITSPSAGSSALVGEPVTVTAESDGECTPKITAYSPAREVLTVASKDAGPLCGSVQLRGQYVPTLPGTHRLVLATATGDQIAETVITAENPPVTATPAPTVTVTETVEAATPTPTPTVTTTTTATATATAKATKTVTAKPKATPTVTQTVEVPSVPVAQPAPQPLPQVVPTVTITASEVGFPAASPAPAPQVAERERDEMPAWLAYQLARQEQTPTGPSFGTVVGAVAVVLIPLAGVGALAWWLIHRRQQRAGHNPQ